MATPDYIRFVDLLSAASSVEEIHSALSDICGAYGFDHFIYGARTPVSFVRPNLFIISGFPPDWWEHYKGENYFQVDPTVAHCARNITPLLWKSLRKHSEDRQAQRFLAEANDFGLRNGVSFPVHGTRGEAAMVSLVSSEEGPQAEEKIARVMPEIQLLTGYVHECVNRVVEVREIGTGEPQLTEREKECLLWASEGKTTWETSQILGISERTVIFHLQNASSKLKVNNRQHAVARAISLRLITPQFS